MNRLPLQFRGTVSSFRDGLTQLAHPGEAVLVTRERPPLLLLVCPCGCGDRIPSNVDRRAGPAWRLYEKKKQGMTVYPSVWRDTGCMSHFIIWRNHILLFQGNEQFADSRADDVAVQRLLDDVLRNLERKHLKAFALIAAELDADPWDVLLACRHLVYRGLAKEGRGKRQGSFRLTHDISPSPRA